ncbi:hypothetical protein Ancab_035202 [Ancistrocladus abbreviatus]
MASALLSTPLFQTSQNREVGGTKRIISSSFYGKLFLPCYRSSRARDISKSRRNALVVASSLGRRVKPETVIPDPDYRIPIVLLGLAGGLAYSENLIPAIPIGLLGLLLLFQTTRVRFVFDDEALEVKVGDELKESGENVFVGGKNRWKMGSSFIMPWWSEQVLQKPVALKIYKRPSAVQHPLH